MADEEKKILDQENKEENVAETVKEEAPSEKKPELKKTQTPSKSTSGKKKKKKSAYRRMVEHHLKVAGIIVGSIALIAILFFTLIASYDFSKKAWHVKFDPFHGY